jgi:REP element-mobilizing transposase RayT
VSRQNALPHPPTRSAAWAWGIVVAVQLLAVLVPRAGHAQARLEAQYEASLAGIVVGKGAWTVEILEDQFSANAYGGTSGLMKTFSSGSGNTSSQGRVVNGALVASNYTASTVTAKRSEQIHMTLQNGNVKDYGIDPVPPVDPDRIPVTEAHRRGVYDPMTASLLRVTGNGDPLSPDACRTGAAIFDGRMRYDLKLDFKRAENVKADKGYHGPAIVCAVYFTPIAGYIPDRPVIKYLAAQRDIEITFVPLAGTRILVPFRMRVPTPLGTAMLEATQFVTQALPPHLAKTQ